MRYDINETNNYESNIYFVTKFQYDLMLTQYSQEI